jgi:hypothetical protein
MTERVEWEFGGPPVGRDRVREIEGRLGINFPDDYVACVMKNQGASPSRDTLNFGGKREKVFDSLLSVTKHGDEEDAYTIEEALEDVGDRLPEDVVPFGTDPFGNLYAFDFRTESPPAVVYWDNEKAEANPQRSILHVADSFTEFLGMLYQSDDEEDDEGEGEEDE